MSALLPLQTGVLALLAADATVTALATGGVHDHVPEGTRYPYIVMGGKSEDPIAMLSRRDGVRGTITLDIWSDYRGDREALLILAAVRAALDDKVITMTPYGSGRLRFEFATTLRDEGLRHAPVRYRVAAV
jgi:hypothetical protein